MCDAATMAAIKQLQQTVAMMAGAMGLSARGVRRSMARADVPGFDPTQTPYPGGGGGWPGANPTGGPGPAGGGAGNPCGGMPYCPPDLVSPDTAAAIKAGPRTATLAPVITTLGAGASATAVTIASNGLQRSITFTDLVTPVLADSGGALTMDALRITVSVNGIEKFQLNGGVFSRGNANQCTTSCGFSVCVGPIEAVTVVVTNQGATAFVGSSMKLDYRSAYRGEAGFDCPPCMNTDGTVS